MNNRKKFWAAAWLVFAIWLFYRATLGAGSSYVQLSETGVWVNADPIDYVAGSAVYSPMRTIGVWVAGLFTIGCLTYLYRDNPVYRFLESVVVGVSAAYMMIIAFWSGLIPNLFGNLWPAWIQSWAMPGLSAEREDFWWRYFVPLVLGAMLLWRLAPRGAWIARWPLAFVVGTTAGVRLIGYFEGDFFTQIQQTMLPLVEFSPSAEEVAAAIEAGQEVPERAVVWYTTLKNWVIVFGVLSGLVYFLFSVEHKGIVGRIAKVGTWVLMISFGAAFGYTVMGRIALLAIRFEFLFDDWLWVIDPLARRTGFFEAIPQDWPAH